MKLYHGSPVKNIKSFNLDKIRGVSVEGNGVYLTHKIDMAKHYAGSEGSVYECNIESLNLFDATKEESFLEMISIISKRIDFNVSSIDFLKETIAGFLSGDYQISDYNGSGLTWQIKNLLFNNEVFCSLSHQDAIISSLEEEIKTYMNQFSVMKYHDKGLGVMFICYRPDLVQIDCEVDPNSLDR